MEPFDAMPSDRPLSSGDKELLLGAATDSVEHGLHRGSPFPVIPAKFPGALQRPGASFVTLECRGELRGCIGSLAAYRSLIEDVVENAYSASCKDGRFKPITFYELPDLEIHLSILSEPEPMQVRDEADLIIQLRPGIDGATLETGSKRGTFLPSVWRQCSGAEDFVRALKRKAGIGADEWPIDIRVSRYTVESIP